MRTWELEQLVVAMLRGQMRSMMRQAGKLARFKESHNPLDALHAKYESYIGEPVVADDAWGHSKKFHEISMQASTLYCDMAAA